ncbi:MAG: radical SAM protein [Kiritimatiellae bacterium]|nr:radical SAM protein [Kiritimatiellia bacterium]
MSAAEASAERAMGRRRFAQLLGGGLAGIGLRAARADRDTPAALADAGQTPVPDWPAYLRLHRTGELRRRADELWQVMSRCRLCPRRCGARRLEGERGFCRSPGARLVIAAHHPHFGEEQPLVGRHGSGTIFFSHCNLRCVFCQNWEISHLGRGAECSVGDLAAMMLDLQRRGCHNINLVTPTHYLPHILKALDIAAARGLQIPLVYNTCGWEQMETVRRLDGIVDIYLPDIKYAESRTAIRYSAGAASYPEITQAAVLEMHRQVGIARVPADGVMRRGLMIRHLVMPNHVRESLQILEWIAANLPKDTYVNIMAQYHPCYRAFHHPEIARRVTLEEYRRVVERAVELGLTNLDSRVAARV